MSDGMRAHAHSPPRFVRRVPVHNRRVTSAHSSSMANQYKPTKLWVTGAEPITESQEWFLRDLAYQLGLGFLPTKGMTRAQAADIISGLVKVRNTARDFDTDLFTYNPTAEAWKVVQAVLHPVEV
ncbi:hypothetical protein OH77DRAFT_1425246 [Trametes cingulata]|nr:hypothetical protein OH77DRAFT_1425246 [Trametes cingulata]